MEIYNISDKTPKLNPDLFSDEDDGTKPYLVTNIKQALKDQSRVNIFINGRYDFSLDLTQVVDFKLKVGRRITKEELEKYRAASEFGKLYQRTLEWALTRPHSIQEAKNYLARKKIKRMSENKLIKNNQLRSMEDKKKYKLKTKEIPIFSDEDAEAVVTRLCERGYLDDKKFAEYYVENRFVKKGASRRRLEQELRRKGVGNDIIAEVLNSSLRQDAEEIQKAIAKKRHKYNDSKLIAYLVRQGFDYQQAIAAVRGTD